MKQLGNLALTCAKRSDVLLAVTGGRANVYVYPENALPYEASFAWDDDEQIEQMIRELNFGKYRPKE